MDYFSSLNASALDPDTPTLFELISAHELSDLIGPSLRYILTYYAQRHPRYLLRAATRFDELYAVCLGLVEYYHLKNWNSTFTEKFYGLKRTRVLPGGGTAAVQLPRTRRMAPDLVENLRRLTRVQVAVSLAAAVLGPYVKEKLDVKYETLKARSLVRNMETEYVRVMGPPRGIETSESPQERPTFTRAEKWRFLRDYWFYKTYPALTAAKSATTLIFYLLYMFSRRTSAHSLLDWLLGIKYSRMSSYDYELADKRAGVAPPHSHGGDGANDDDDGTPLLGKLVNALTTRAGLNSLQRGALSGLSYALPTAMFLLKFLEWWSTSDFAHKLAAKGGRGGILDGNLPVPDRKEYAPAAASSPKTSEDAGAESEDEEEEELGEPLAKGEPQAPREKYVRVSLDSSLCPLCGQPITNATAIETGAVFCYPCIYKHLESGTAADGGRCPVTGTRLLLCRYDAEHETWEVGGLRRLMV